MVGSSWDAARNKALLRDAALWTWRRAVRSRM
jgi:hypothetical protein